jgi:hypothetical protein
VSKGICKKQQQMDDVVWTVPVEAKDITDSSSNSSSDCGGCGNGSSSGEEEGKQ